MTLLSHTWPRGQDINLFLVEPGIPFDADLVEAQMVHEADFLRFISNGVINANYRGRVPEANYHAIKDGNVYVEFKPEGDEGRWATTLPKPYSSAPPEGGLILFDSLDVDCIENFNIFPHELQHVLGVAHNSQDSIMCNAPYLAAKYQSLYRLYDYQQLYNIFLCPILEMPTGYGFGKKDPDQCVISIPRIKVSDTEYKAVYLYGEKQDGDWLLWTYPIYAVDAPAGDCLAEITPQNQLTFPLRFMGTSFRITADIRETVEIINDEEVARVEFFNVGLQEAA